MHLSFGDLKNPPSTLPAKVNLCPTDPRFADLCNRGHSVLLDHGSWWGTEQEAHLFVGDSCIVLPACVASLEGLRACGEPIRIENEWYRLTPGFNPQRYNESHIWWEFRDEVPTWQQITSPSILRCFIASDTDAGRTIKFIGYDKNGKWVRTRQNGIYQDGELVTLAKSVSAPFVDTVTEWMSVTAVIKDQTDDTVSVFAHPKGSDLTMIPIGLYQWWETRPTYQRFKIIGWPRLSDVSCCPANQVIARVKLTYIPVQNDDDLFLIQNRQAMEYAVQAMKALDDGNNAAADVLLYGSPANLRIGAIPLLEQELRTKSGDRFTGNIRILGERATKRAMCGFI